MKQWIKTAILIFIFLCLHNQAWANHRGINGLIIGGGAGAIMGQAIGRNLESTVIGATVGGILGTVIGSDNSHGHQRTVVVQDRPRGPHGRHFNYAPRHHQPRVVFHQPYKHGKKHYKKRHVQKKSCYKKGNVHYGNHHRHPPRHQRPHNKNYNYR